MNVESEAIKVLAESLAKAYNSVIAQNNRNYVNNQIRNSSGGGSYSGSISASQVRGLGNAVITTVNNDLSSPTSSLSSGVINAVALSLESLTADTAIIENLFAQYGRFTNLVAEKAQFGEIDTEAIYSDIADIGLGHIGQAVIGTAQIHISSTDTAFIREGLSGKQYIDSLAVSEANIVSLNVGTLLLNNNQGELVRIYVDGDDIKTEPVSYDGDDIININSMSGDTIINNTLNGEKVIEGTVSGSKLIANTITTQQLNASEIFAKNATIMDLIADNISAVKLFANEGFIPTLTTTIIQSAQIGEGLDISKNSTIEITNERINQVVYDTNKRSATFVQEDPPENAKAGDVWFNPTSANYYIAHGASGGDAPIFAQNEDGELLYSYNDDATETVAIMVSGVDGELYLDGDYSGDIYSDVGYSIVNDELVCDVAWEEIENEAFSQVSQTADKITWLVQEGTSKSNMSLTPEMLSLVTDGVSISVQQIAIEAMNTLIRVDDDGLHIGEINSDKEVLIDDESMNVVIAGETYSRFSSNYAQFGNYRIYNDATGGLAFKRV